MFRHRTTAQNSGAHPSNDRTTAAWKKAIRIRAHCQTEFGRHMMLDRDRLPAAAGRRRRYRTHPCGSDDQLAPVPRQATDGQGYRRGSGSAEVLLLFPVRVVSRRQHIQHCRGSSCESRLFPSKRRKAVTCRRGLFKVQFQEDASAKVPSDLHRTTEGLYRSSCHKETDQPSTRLRKCRR